jgi:hypothetical protein
MPLEGLEPHGATRKYLFDLRRSRCEVRQVVMLHRRKELPLRLPVCHGTSADCGPSKLRASHFIPHCVREVPTARLPPTIWNTDVTRILSHSFGLFPEETPRAFAPPTRCPTISLVPSSIVIFENHSPANSIHSSSSFSHAVIQAITDWTTIYYVDNLKPGEANHLSLPGKCRADVGAPGLEAWPLSETRQTSQNSTLDDNHNNNNNNNCKTVYCLLIQPESRRETSRIKASSYSQAPRRLRTHECWLVSVLYTAQLPIQDPSSPIPHTPSLQNNTNIEATWRLRELAQYHASTPCHPRQPAEAELEPVWKAISSVLLRLQLCSSCPPNHGQTIGRHITR